MYIGSVIANYREMYFYSQLSEENKFQIRTIQHCMARHGTLLHGTSQPSVA